MKAQKVYVAISGTIAICAFLAPAAPFSIDGALYYEMARAMAERSALHIAENGGVEGAPPLTKSLTVVRDDKVYPQYPGGYGILAAPFYMLFGIRGLMLMNAVAFGASIWLTFSIATRLFDKQVASWAAGIFALASFAPAYAFGVWPHMLALSCWLAAVYSALLAQSAPSRSKALMLYALSGLLIGAGVNVRVDIILAAPVLFFWLRLFAKPGDRLAPFALFLGLIPGFLFSALLNEIKFGTLNPLSYGPSEGHDSLAHYTPILLLAFSATLIVWTINLSAFARLVAKKLNPYWIAGFLAGAAIIILATPLRELSGKIICGVYVLVFNLQAHDAYAQIGVERNEYGHLLFWDYPKKALIQSIPWAPLAILPLWYSLRGKNTSAVWLCFMAAAAPIAFYALEQWHGGRSYNMRYFMPALPFIAILSAHGLRELTTRAGPARQSVLIALVAAGALYLGLQEIGQSSDRFFAPAALYPQWIIAALVFVSASFTITRPFSERPRMLASGVALFALAYGVAISLYEEIGHERTRAKEQIMSRDVSAPIPAGALVITASQLNFTPAEENGAFVLSPQEDATSAAQAARAFANAGRCVYFHTGRMRDLVAPALDMAIDPEPLWAPSTRFGDDPRLAFFALQEQKHRCRFD